MNFLYPAFLSALALLAVPIIIHLFNFRRYKTVYFSSVKFLKEVKEETAVKSNVKHWLTLIARLLAVLFLVLAFAQPVIPVGKANDGASGPRAISVYIDNSFSMNALDDEETLLNRAQRKAGEIAQAFDQNDRFQLLTNELNGRQQRFYNKEAFVAMVDEIELSATARKLNDIQMVQKRTFDDEDLNRNLSFWISDFQKNMVEVVPDTSISLTLLPLQPLRDQNVYIDSSWSDKPIFHLNQPNTLFVRLINDGEEDLKSSRLTLRINEEVKAIADFSVEANSSAIDTVNFSIRQPGWKSLQLSINDYPVTFDDQYYMTFNIVEQVSVLSINELEESKYLSALYNNADKFVFNSQMVNQLDYSALRNYSLIVLNNLEEIPSGLASQLQQFIESGGAVLIFPSANAALSSYNNFLTVLDANKITGLSDAVSPIKYLNAEHEIFNDVFEKIPNNLSLPEAKIHFTLSKQVRSSRQPLLQFKDRSSFLESYDFGLGKLYLCVTPLEEGASDFPAHALFVPLLYKMALSGGSARKSAYTLGQDQVVEATNRFQESDNIYKMKGSATEFIPRQKTIGPKVLLSLGDEVRHDGIYQIYSTDQDQFEPVALNYDRAESKLDYYESKELKEMFGDYGVRILDAVKESITPFVQEIDKGIVLWKVCLILALIFIGAEVLFLRLLP